ncbi:17013_t:CDS:10, partial [Acaulospora morrowiae]
EFYMSPGIYLLVIPPLSLGLVIHWPEPGCYEENISSQRKKNMINLHRYLTRLTDHQLCLMSEFDLECFIWNSENDGKDDSDEENEGVYYEYEVKKSQEEQEDFEIFPGFQINLPQQIISDIRDGYPLQPTVVESVTSQTLITKKKINATSKMFLVAFETKYKYFKEEFSKRLYGYALRISKNMSIKNLEILIKNGLPEMEEELLDSYRKKLEDVKMQIELKKAQERGSIKEDAEIFTKYVWKKLRQEYIEFELLIDKELTNNSATPQVPDDETMKQSIENIKCKHSVKCDQIEEALKINSKKWKELKKRYILLKDFIQNVYSENISMDQGGDTQSQLSNEQVRQSMCQAVFEMFMDEELDYYRLIRKYCWSPYQKRMKKVSSPMELWTYLVRIANSKANITENYVESLVITTADKKFIKEITSIEFESLSNQKHELTDIFLKEYKRWRKEIFPKNIQEIVPRCDGSYMREVTKKFDSEYLRSKEIIEEEEFNGICKEIENKFPTGYYVSYEIETIQPDQLRITIYPTSIGERDNLLLSEDIPTPKFNKNSDDFGNSFQINLEAHEIRNISQFENKFFLALWNNKENQLEIYFDTASRLSLSLQSAPFKILYPEKSTLISVNEPKRLIGLYDISSGVLNIYAFDEKFVKLLPRIINVQLVQWYDNTVPKIQQFFFLKNTEDICFVEKNGRSRVYMIALNQFRPGLLLLPPDSFKVLSTPDGACIVAFTKDIVLEQENENKDANGSPEETYSSYEPLNRNDYNPENQVKTLKAHVFFCANFGSPANKVIPMPKYMQSVEHFQFSCIKKQQIHLTTIDVINGRFCSLITRVALEKKPYRFQQKSSKRLTEKELNNYVNVYQYTFEKYPTYSCIDIEQNKSPSLTMVLDLSTSNVNGYERKFRDYVNDMYEELKRTVERSAIKIGNFKMT